MNRRHFLLSTAASGAAFRASALASPNDTVRVCCVGVHGQGQSHLRAYARMPNVEIAAICDVDESVLEQRLQDTEKMTKKAPGRLHRPAQSSRRQVDRRDLDRDAQPRPCPPGHLGLPGRQRRIRGEALRV